MLEYGADVLGFNVAFFILGMAGGLVRTIIKDKISLRSGLVNLTVGGILSTYFTPVIAHHMGMKEKESVFATAITIGFMAMGIFIVYGHIEIWAKRNPKFFISQFANWLANVARGMGANGNNKSTDADTPGPDTDA